LFQKNILLNIFDKFKLSQWEIDILIFSFLHILLYLIALEKVWYNKIIGLYECNFSLRFKILFLIPVLFFLLYTCTNKSLFFENDKKAERKFSTHQIMFV